MLLGLCVPTYHRAERLRHVLKGAVDQIAQESLQDKVQLCVSDNASPDHTGEVVRSFTSSFGGQIIYSRLPENQGFARNFYNTVRLSTAEYVAFCGDDDGLLPGGLQVLLKAAQLNRDVVLTNTWPGEKVKARGFAPGEVLALPDAQSSNELLGMFHPSFIGNVLIRRSVFLRHAGAELTRSAYPHVGIVLRALRESPGSFVNEPVFEVEAGERRWQAYQSVYTAVDMARLQTEEVFMHRGVARRTIWRGGRTLVKALPRAVYVWRTGLIQNKPGNPYAELSLKNLFACYRCSTLLRLLCLIFWYGARAVPLRWLKLVLPGGTSQRPTE